LRVPLALHLRVIVFVGESWVIQKVASGLGGPALFRTVPSLPAAKGATFAACGNA
jgi:hypothetical protein